MIPAADKPDITPLTAQVAQVEGSTAQPDVGQIVQTATLRQRLDEIVTQNENKSIATSVQVRPLGAKEALYSHNADDAQFAASINKLAVALLLAEDVRTGTTSLEQSVTWQAGDVRSGFGTYDQPGAATTATVRELLYDMLNYSGNTALRALVIYSLAGPQNVNERLAAYPELATTRLTLLPDGGFYLGNSTAKEAAWLIERLLAPASPYQAFVKDALATNIFSYYGVRSQLESQDYIVLANKVGILDDAEGNNRHDVGVIYNTRSGQAYSYAFMTTTPAGQVAETAQAEHSLDLLGRYVLRYAGDKPDNRPASASPSPNGRQITPETRVRF